MKKNVHIDITKSALSGTFSVLAIEQICLANVGQDALIYQFGHDHFHVDSNSFKAAENYRIAQQAKVVAMVQAGDLNHAWIHFGKLTHTVQDLYSHSNYVELYLEKHPGCLPEEINPLDEDIFNSTKLISGRLYYPFEVITFFRNVPNWIVEMFPADSHAKMNKDYPGRRGFEHARQAAIFRTWHEFIEISKILSENETALFSGKTKE